MEKVSPQASKPETMPKEDKGLFLQVPYCVIDNLDMTDNAKIGFIRFCRLFNKKDKTIEFRGYYRGLATALKKSPAHTISIVEQWVKFNLVEREETLDGVILRANTVAIWHRNKIHKEAEQCLNYEQQRLYEVKNYNSSVQNINTAVQNINTAVYEINTAMKIMNSRGKSETAPEAAARLNEIASRLLDYTRLLLDKRDDENSDPSLSGYANATPHTFPLFEIDLFAEDTPEAQHLSYSQKNTTTTLLETSIQKSVAGQSDGYMQESMPVDEPAKPNKRASKPKVEQDGLPLQVDLGPLVMPASDAAWPNAETAVTISEVLRERRYTPKSRMDQLTAARKMFKEFSTITRVQFETAFRQRNDAWWHEHVGLLSLADLMAKDSSKAIRLSKILERLDSKPATTSQPASQQQQAKIDTFAHVPAFGGMTQDQLDAAFVDAQEFIKSLNQQKPQVAI